MCLDLQMAEYEGCESFDLLVQNFWEVLFQLSKEDQLKFLCKCNLFEE